MNKNYKSNLKKRNVEESKKVLNIKEFAVKSESLLLDYLINELHYSRNNAKNLLSHHLISIDGAPISQFDFKIFPGDTLIISKKPIKAKKRKDLPIIFENDEFIVINKPAGLLSIASDKEKSATAYRMVTDYVQQKDKHNRVFVVHRLDKETSGILMFAKNEKIRDILQEKWNDIVKSRGYYAVVEGIMEKSEDHIVNYLRMNKENLMYVTPFSKNSQKCITDYKVLKTNKKYSLLDVHIYTGRKNQIRVTLGSLGHYVLGDDKYGEPENPINRLCLHAYQLKFEHPISKKIYSFEAVLPKEMADLV
ncbi:MAG: RluA family pseudouridine synthase [Candidatus Onthovivens sp.]|nr:RluA family pseudouridine synthase [Candidatus Onthovivens sp.]